MKSANPSHPPCATWKLWIGPEVEGHVSLGERTIFVRELPDNPDITGEWLRIRSRATRIWFCKEFTNWRRLLNLAQGFDDKSVCVEVMWNRYDALPKEIRRRFRIYVKLAPELKELKAGDHICVGLPFSDEGFEIGKGQKVSPQLYQSDIRIL